MLKNGLFKDEFAGFLIKEWQKENYLSIIGRRKLILSHGGKCTVKQCINDCETITMQPDELHGDHEEADTLVGFHISQIAKTNEGTIVVRASDTDILVIILRVLGKGEILNTIINDCGTGNARHFVNATEIYNTLEKCHVGLSRALPGLHDFTRTDYTTCFFRKGKVKALELMQSNSQGEFIDFFSILQFSNTPDYAMASKYVCRLWFQGNQ